MGNFCRYIKQKKQVSYDSGATWQDVTPAEYQKGALYEPNSQDCGYVGNFERWTNSGTTCNGYDLYNLQVKEISSDMTNWTATSETQLGTLIEANSASCGYQQQDNFRIKLKYSNGNVEESACTSNTHLSSVGCYGYTAVTVGDCIRTLGQRALRCDTVKKIELPRTITKIGINAFPVSSQTEIKIEATNPPKLEGSIFVDESYYTPNATILVPCDSVEAYRKHNILDDPTLGDDGFGWIWYVPLIQGYPNTCTTMPAKKFYANDSNGNTYSIDCTVGSPYPTRNEVTSLPYTSFTSVSFTDYVVTTGNYPYGSFENCTLLKNITFGINVWRIEYRSFKNTGIEELVLPSNIKRIGEEAFMNCSQFTKIVIPETVTYIEPKAFYNCTNLTKAIFLGKTPPYLSTEVFNGCDNLTIYVPKGYIGVYSSANYCWPTYANKIKETPYCGI